MKTFTRPKRWTALLAILALGSAAFSTGCVLDQATPVVSVVGAGVVAAYGNTTLPPDVASVLSKASAAICPDVMLIQQLGLTTTGTIAGNSENAAVALCANGNPTNVSIAVSDIETLWPYLLKVDAHFTAKVEGFRRELAKKHMRIEIDPGFDKPFDKTH